MARGLVCKILLLSFSFLAIALAPALAAELSLYFYTAENCPHCQEYRPQIEALVGKYPEVTLVEKDIWVDRQAFKELIDLLATHGDLAVATPTVFVADRVWVGLDQHKLAELDELLAACLQNGCPDALERLDLKVAEQPQVALPAPPSQEPAAETVMLPWLGEMDARAVSLPLVTLILGLLDSFNPCAFFVLLFLLSLMVHAHSRTRMLAVGLVFVLFSGLIYFLFMAAWLNLFLLTGGTALITLLAGVVALLIGLFNIKDFYLFHRGPSLSIPERVKPTLYHRTRNLLQSASYPSLLGGTALLAIAANSYELLCTAGFPMVYTRILTLKALPAWQYYAYLALYNLVYIIPLLLIVILFAVTLGAHRLTERQGRLLKLVSGVMMAELGLVLLSVPQLLNNLAGTLLLFGGAVLLVLMLLGVERLCCGRSPQS